MPQLLVINLFPSICLLLSFIFVAWLHRKTISRTLSRCQESYRWKRWTGTYTRVEDQEIAIAIDEEALKDAKSISELSSDEDQPVSPLAGYFDPHTSVLYEYILEPASPPTANWEHELQQRIDNGRGLGAAIDRVVDSAVQRFMSAMGYGYV